MGAGEEETNMQERIYLLFFKIYVKLIGPCGHSPSFANMLLYCNFAGGNGEAEVE